MEGRERELGKGVEVTMTGSSQKQPASAVALYSSDCFLSSSSLKPSDWQRSSEGRSVLLPWLRASLASCVKSEQTESESSLENWGYLCQQQDSISVFLISYCCCAIQLSMGWQHHSDWPGPWEAQSRVSPRPDEAAQGSNPSWWSLRSPVSCLLY